MSSSDDVATRFVFLATRLEEHGEERSTKRERRPTEEPEESQCPRSHRLNVATCPRARPPRTAVSRRPAHSARRTSRVAFSAGKRFGSRTYTWDTADLDRFMRGMEPSATLEAGRSSTPSSQGGVNEQAINERQQLEVPMEQSHQTHEAPGRVGTKGGRVLRQEACWIRRGLSAR